MLQAAYPIIIGSDKIAYSIARSLYAATKKKPCVICASILRPSVDSTIMDIHKVHYVKDGALEYPKKIIRAIRSYVKKTHGSYDARVVLYVPNEIYLERLRPHLGDLPFPVLLPAPDAKISAHYGSKAHVYAVFDALHIDYPKTQVIGPSNYEQLSLEGKLVLKASDDNEFKKVDLATAQRKKVYFVESREEAIQTLKSLYHSSTPYHGEMLVQEYIVPTDGMNEFSVVGYRSADDHWYLAQAQSLLEDPRPLKVGNHLVLCDAQEEELYAITKKFLRAIDYFGFFNMDFIRRQDGRFCALEINQRLAASFYYATMGGVNLPHIALQDLGDQRRVPIPEQKPFLWYDGEWSVLSSWLSPAAKTHLTPERLANQGHSLLNPDETNPQRATRLQAYIQDWMPKMPPIEEGGKDQ